MLSLSPGLALTACAVALCTQPAFAHTISTGSHRASYRHARPRDMAAAHHRRDVASRPRLARIHWRRGSYALARAGFAAPSGSGYSQYGHGDSAPMQDWQPRAATPFVQQDFARRPFIAESAPVSAWSGAWNGGSSAGWGVGARSQFQDTQVQEMAEQAASANGVPVSLVDRVIKRESGGNPHAVSRGNYGLMQIRLGTARTMGYEGSAAGLLDPATNMNYAVRYLAGAYRAAAGSESRAVALYARGYDAAARVENASFDAPQPQGEAMGQSAGFSDNWSAGYAPAYRQRLRRRFVF